MNFSESAILALMILNGCQYYNQTIALVCASPMKIISTIMKHADHKSKQKKRGSVLRVQTKETGLVRYLSNIWVQTFKITGGTVKYGLLNWPIIIHILQDIILLFVNNEVFITQFGNKQQTISYSVCIGSWVKYDLVERMLSKTILIHVNVILDNNFNC